MSEVSQAIGTQRQFSRQPQLPYRKKLNNLKASVGNYSGEAEGVLGLAQALGVFGDAWMKEQASRDARREQLGEAEASRIFTMQSEEDIHKLSTLDMLGQSDKFNLMDNPYAIARIDEMKGEYLNQHYKTQYETEVLPNNPLPKTAQENVKNFEDFMATSLSEDDVSYENSTAFNKGFYGKRINDVLSVDRTYRTKMQQDLSAERNAMLASKRSTFLDASLNMTPEQLAAQGQELHNDEILSCLPVSDRIKNTILIAEGLTKNGNVEQLDAYGETVVYFDSVTGEAVKVKDVVPLSELKTDASIAHTKMYGDQYRSILSDLAELPSAAYVSYFDKLRESNPNMYRAVAPQLKSLVEKRQKEETKAREVARGEAIVEYNKSSGKEALIDRLQAAVNGLEKDSSNRLVSSKKYMGLSSKGEAKELTFTEDDIVNTLDELFAQNVATMGVEGHAANMRLLQCDLASPYRNTLKHQMTVTMGQLTVNGLRTGADGQPMLPDNLDGYVALYRSNPSVFRQLFPNETGAQMGTLVSLIDTNGTKEGVAKFAIAKEQLADTDWRKEADKRVNNQISFGNNSFEIKSLSGADGEANVPYDRNPALVGAVKANMTANMAAGMSQSDAYATAKADCAKSYVYYEGMAVPRIFFNGIPATNQGAFAEAYLRTFGDDTTMQYSPSSDAILIRHANGSYTALNRPMFTQQVTTWMAGMTKEQRLLLEDVTGEPEVHNTDYYVARMVD